MQSLGGAADGHDAFVSLFSVMNAVGRLTFGFLPERCMHAFGTPRCARFPSSQFEAEHQDECDGVGAPMGY